MEAAFQSFIDEEDKAERSKLHHEIAQDDGDPGSIPQPRSDGKLNTTLNNDENSGNGRTVKVPVNEDFLFDVDIEKRELAPTYWLGPVYEVRRGTWFFQGMCVAL